jgi:hypothetical protein
LKDPPKRPMRRRRPSPKRDGVMPRP